MVMVVIVADCNLYIPDTSIYQDIFLLDTVDGTLPPLSSVFQFLWKILLLGSISQMGKLRNMEVKTQLFLDQGHSLLSDSLFLKICKYVYLVTGCQNWDHLSDSALSHHRFV